MCSCSCPQYGESTGIFRNFPTNSSPNIVLSVQSPILEQFRIDTDKFVIFGVINNIICRVHRYPLTVAYSSSAMESDNFDKTNNNIPQQDLKVFVDGKHSFDEIAVNLGKSYTELQNLFSQSMYK